MNHSVTRWTVTSATVMALILTGCGQTQPDYDPAAAKQLQAQVHAVTTSASSADYSSALAALDELDLQLKNALARKEITQARYDSILSSAASVRSDIEAAIAALIPPAPVPAPAPTGSVQEDEGYDEREEREEREDLGGEDKGKGKGSDKDNDKGSDD
ncbi:MAG: hypothetical protein JWP30_1417 [Homoserinimonas sp.]|nr:hypothetical protein [Homoserinimonas sp.]